jgi:tRNA pseudouridine synthase 9
MQAKTDKSTMPDVLTTPARGPGEYFLDDGLRRVEPYHFTWVHVTPFAHRVAKRRNSYNTNCKERWRGRGLLDIFSSEFRDRPLEYYREALEKGAIVVNGKAVPDVNYAVKNGDV